MFVQLNTVLPVRYLPPRNHGQSGKHCHRTRSKNNASVPLLCKKLSCAPGDDDKQPYERHVCIAVGHSLQPHLHQPNHRYERSEIPQPAYGEPSTAAKIPNYQNRYTQQQHAGSQHLPNWKIGFRVRIENPQIGRPEHFPDIFCISDESISNAILQRDALYKRSFGLHHKNNDTRRSRECQKRQFLQKAARKRSCPKSFFARIPLLPSQRKTLERPIIQQKQYKRQCH